MTRYELLDRIGVGGMAEIFRGKAIAAGGFEKPVAIKRILPHLSQDKRFVELLIAEAKVLSLLKHRNIVQIFDVGLGDDGQYFLVMEYVDGRDVGAVQRGLEARRGRIPFDLVLHLGSEICEALEHAHSARAPDGKPMSLVHRDVSPSNVLLSRAGEVKLTDFGIAKRAEQEATGHGAVRGKFAYISPEQARNEHLEPRSDVFSVGILLWELVTNRRLFSGLGDMDALRAVREAEIPRARSADPRLSPEIDGLIAAALSRDPKQRPTAGQLGQQLRSLRYSLELTSGDPATELAKILDTIEDTDRRASSPQVSAPLPALHADVEVSEATVIRIHTADAFSMGDEDSAGVARARQVIDRFEEEETRLAQLSRDEIAMLHAQAVRDSGELTSAIEPPRPTGRRPQLDSDAIPTGTSAPLHLNDVDSSGPFESDEATRLLPPTRRTPPPQRVARPPTQPDSARKPRASTQPPPKDRSERFDRVERSGLEPERKPRMMSQPPPMPAEDRTPAPRRYTPPQGTVQQRLPPTPTPSSSASQAHPPPPAPMTVPRPMPQHPPQAAPMMMPPRPQQPVLMAQQPQQAAVMPTPMMAQQPQPQAPQPMAMPGYGSWGAPPPRPPEMYARPSAVAMARPRRTIQPWMLVIGALVMALLAFAVTRAFIHSSNKPAAESK